MQYHSGLNDPSLGMAVQGKHDYVIFEYLIFICLLFLIYNPLLNTLCHNPYSNASLLVLKYPIKRTELTKFKVQLLHLLFQESRKSKVYISEIEFLKKKRKTDTLDWLKNLTIN